MLDKPKDKFTFTKDIFTKDYYDKEGDSPLQVTILNKLTYGVILYKNQLVLNSENFQFDLSEVNNVQYMRISSLAYTENIQFKTSDNNPNKLYSDMATFTINVNAYVNNPPNQIGDNEITIDNGETYVFTVEDFTENTTPPYEDPENDAPYKLKILSIPGDGSKLVLGVTILNVNDEVFFSDIAAGNLKYIPAVNSAAHSIDFDFTISDIGSEEFYD